MESNIVTIDGEVIDLLAEQDQAYQCRQDVIDIKDNIEKSFLALGEKFYLISSRKWYLLFDCENFDEYIETLNMSRAWVFQLQRIHSKYRIDLGVDDKRLSHIGVTKLAQMASSINKVNQEHLLNVADESSVNDLKREIGVVPEIGSGSAPLESMPSGYYYLTQAHGDIAGELTKISKRSIEIFKDGSGTIIGKV